MRNSNSRKIWRKVFESKPVLAVFGLVLIVFAWNILDFWGKMRDTELNQRVVEEKVMRLQQQKGKLLEDIETLNTDEGKERVFRENYGLAKDGEGLIIIVEDKNQKEEKNASDKGFFNKIKEWFNR